MPESWMLGRVTRLTKPYHQTADADRLAMVGTGADRSQYAAFLTRIHGFEAPLEIALQMTDGLEQWVDVRGRGHVRLLRSDLQALGTNDASQLPRCRSVLPFGHPAEALGWIYVVERNTVVHAEVQRHLRTRLTDVVKVAGSYLAGPQRSNGQRMCELGAAMDRMARDPTCIDRIVNAAKAAFRAQHNWYEVAAPRQRVA